MLKIRNTWEKYYLTLSQLPDRLKQPVPFIVEALPTFKRYRINRVLDLGCGAGRHCIYLAKNGLDVVGVDSSESALKLVKVWSKDEKLANVRLAKATMTNLPFDKCNFDVVISISVIHHAMKRDIQKTVEEIHRVLKEKGVFLANLASVKDYRCGKGQKIEDNTYRVLEHFEGKRFGELHHFFGQLEISELLVNFSKAEVESLVGGTKDQPHHYWKITAVK